jgi:tRNA G18 (ribose-2'-O)-methylase SpoU
MDNQHEYRRKLRTSEMNRLSTTEFKQATKIMLHLVIDNLRSAHNVGSVFRTADAFRLCHIHLCDRTPIPPHKGIHKTALGATESVNWSVYDSTLAAVKALKGRGVKVVSLEQTENSLMLDDFCVALNGSDEIALVLGNEVSGVDQAVIDASDAVVEIPQLGTKHSLNVAVSTGIAIWAISRKLQPV